ncbi:aminodeoxychorismate lyase [Alcanivorax sp.]|uniref:aminodeoxychorismate lyase n=1 Tax=Alcanivorax sp. TaxID=1872427 RepID=UPI000C634BAE|nr:aminodeoxychorismate lyase [Alcanivorax sp.]MBQ26270.1 aminodeoxychorismate lyase [Alcanivorax sp.]
MPLNPRDRGLAYGDGVFETVRVAASGEAPLWSRHRARMVAGLHALDIALPDQSRLDAALNEGIAALRGEPGVVKLTVTRGVGGRGYLPPASAKPTVLWQSGELPAWSERLRREGLVLGLCQTPLYPEPLAGFKHLNRLPQVMARREVAGQGWDEGLLLSTRRQPLEATSMNLFARFADHWWMPDLAAAGAGVAGVMRSHLFDTLQQQGEKVICDLRPLSQLRTADGLFLCNSIVGVLPVRKLAQWHWPVLASVRELQQSTETFLAGSLKG